VTGAERRRATKTGKPDGLPPAYERVAAALRARVLEGALTPGDRLPTEPALAGELGVSRSTVREALRSLGSEGLLRTVRGVNGGTFVAEVEPRASAEQLRTRIGILVRQRAISEAELHEARAALDAASAGSGNTLLRMLAQSLPPPPDR
jgi:GntR family transcriptional repressor for pyruvate dehydrogenase complex